MSAAVVRLYRLGKGGATLMAEERCEQGPMLWAPVVSKATLVRRTARGVWWRTAGGAHVNRTAADYSCRVAVECEWPEPVNVQGQGMVTRGRWLLGRADGSRLAGCSCRALRCKCAVLEADAGDWVPWLRERG